MSENGIMGKAEQREALASIDRDIEAVRAAMTAFSKSFDKDAPVSYWIGQLRNAFYDTEDALKGQRERIEQSSPDAVIEAIERMMEKIY